MLDALIDPANAARFDRLMECVDTGAIAFYVTEELIGEAWRVTENPAKAHLLQPFARMILKLTEGRHIRDPELIVMSELIGEYAPFASDRERLRLRGHLMLVAGGHANIPDVRRIAREFRLRNEDANPRWRKMVEDGREKIRAASEVDREAFLATPFPEVDRRQWEAQGRITAFRYAREALSTAQPIWKRWTWRVLGALHLPGSKTPKSVADDVMAHPDRYQFTRRFVRMLAIMLWTWLARREAKKEPVHTGDHNDARQVTIFPAIDYFVSNDRAVRVSSGLHGDDPGKVLSIDELLDRNWC